MLHKKIYHKIEKDIAKRKTEAIKLFEIEKQKPIIEQNLPFEESSDYGEMDKVRIGNELMGFDKEVQFDLLAGIMETKSHPVNLKKGFENYSRAHARPEELVKFGFKTPEETRLRILQIIDELFLEYGLVYDDFEPELSDRERQSRWTKKLEDDIRKKDSYAIAHKIPMGEEPEGWDIKQTSELLDELPYVISYLFHKAESEPQPHKKYKELLRFAENIMAYLTIVSIESIVTLINNDNKSREVKLLPKDLILSSFQGGVSPGNWMNFIRKFSQIGKKLETKYPNQDIFPLELNKLMYRGKRITKFHSQLDKTVEMKNDFKHDRFPTSEAEYQKAIDELTVILSDILQALELLDGYIMIKIMDFDIPFEKQYFDASVKKYIGIHPILPQSRIKINRSIDIHKNHLYVRIVGSSKDLIHLYPFIVSENCSKCNDIKTFYIEKIDFKHNQISYKSFENGHMIKSSESENLKNTFEHFQAILNRHAE